jgi:hypothetical protein
VVRAVHVYVCHWFRPHTNDNRELGVVGRRRSACTRDSTHSYRAAPKMTSTDLGRSRLCYAGNNAAAEVPSDIWPAARSSSRRPIGLACRLGIARATGAITVQSFSGELTQTVPGAAIPRRLYRQPSATGRPRSASRVHPVDRIARSSQCLHDQRAPSRYSCLRRHRASRR